MKKSILVNCLLLVATIYVHAQQYDFLKLTGPYLRQKPRGMTAEDNRLKNWQEDISYLIIRMEAVHPNLYANIARETFMEYVDQLKQRIPSTSDVEMILGIQELVARIRNTHTVMTPLLYMNIPDALKRQFEYYPVYYYPFNDGLYVIYTPEKYKSILGRKVIKIGNLTTQNAMKELSRFIAADNEMTALGSIPRFCLNDGQLLHYIGAADSPQKITLTLANDEGEPFECELATVPYSELNSSPIYSMRTGSKNPTPLYMKQQSKNYWFEYLPESEAVYLHINLMNHNESEPFGEFCRRMFDTMDSRSAKKLIIDVRLCPGGDHIELPLLKGILSRPHIDKPDCLFLIIGRITGSAAEHLTAQFETYTNATLIGEPTGSKPNQFGAMQKFTLPHSRLEISCATKYFQDAEPSDYSMTSEPDIFVSRTSNDYRDNRDPVLDRILEFDSFKQKRSEFFKSMSEAYTIGGTAKLRQVYQILKEEYNKYGFSMENLLYNDLDQWVGNNQKNENDYIEFLKFIHAELPNSIRINYDLAYWMNKIGDKAEAKRLYQKCIQLNPEHHHAKMRLRLMEIDRF